MNEPEQDWQINRRSFLKGTVLAAAGIGAGSLLTLTGCGGEGNEQGVGGTGKPVNFTPGAYVGTAEGKHGPVTVEVVFDATAITSIEVTRNTESEDLTDIALTVIPQAIMHTQSLGVDTVSGATLTSLAIIDAVADCAEQAGVDSGELKARPASVDAIVQQMEPGTYTGESFGKFKTGDSTAIMFGGPAVIEPTKVEIEVDEQSIKSVKVLATSDTPGFKEPAAEIMSERIVGQQSIYADTCTGATLSATAITAATAKALTAAKANLVGFAKATPHDTSLTEDYDCDLVIVGGGTTGTVAALRAIEEGLKVVIVEKTYRISGMGALASGPLGVGSSLHRQVGMNMTATELFTKMMEEADWKINAPLVNNWLQGSGPMMDWLQERWTSIGDAGFMLPNDFDPYNYTCMFGKGTQKFQDLYDNYILPQGATLLYGVMATQILTEDDKVTGVVGTNLATGATVTVYARAALVCTGGFGGNDAKLKEMFGTDNFFLTGLSNSTGEGLVMCESLGCTLSEEIEPHMSEFCGNPSVDFFAGYMKFINQFGFLALDPAGNRFMNEEVFITGALESGGSALRRVGHCFIIFTQGDFDKIATQGAHGILSQEYTTAVSMRPFIFEESNERLSEEMTNVLAKEQAFKADTLEELARVAGFEEADFTAAIGDYKKMIAAGSDPVFGKSPVLLHPLDDGPFYAVKIIPPIFGTYNGIKVDGYFRPLDENQKPRIAGLYVGGQDSGGVFSYPYTNWLGATSSYALTSGMLAASYIKEYLGR
jgi:fumarate reductase flavoprotein subunit